MLKRLLIAAALLAMIHGVVLALRYERWPSEIAPPDIDLAQIPYKLGESPNTWTGKDSEPDPLIFEALQADHVVDRSYTKGEADILLHASDYQSLIEGVNYRWVPHPPEICYGRAGFQPEGQKDKVLTLDDGRSVRVRLTTFERKGSRILVLFWYHFGDEIVLDHSELRNARWRLIGKQAWPAVTKFMLQIPGDRPERAEKTVAEFARLVIQWALDHRQPAGAPGG
jgi:hypothetical protein